MTDRKCGDCRSEVIGKIRRGRCENCYRAHLRSLKASGEYAPVEIRNSYGRKNSTTVQDRILRQTTPGPNGCVVFTGRLDRWGYAMVKTSRGRYGAAHRLIYKAMVGPIPDGRLTDHLCHTSDAECPGGNRCLHRRCVNPYHLEPVTPAQNNERGLSVTAVNARKTHCINGHEFTASNTAWRKPERAGGKRRRICRACKRERKRLARQATA